MRRVLFVDDEPQILDGLRNLLRRQRHRWETAFALGGPAALAELGRRPFDIVVSDMRMPGMDGATLLENVRRDHPGVARVILSGQADRAAALRTVPVAHQFLAKPCDADELCAVVERTCALQARLTGESFREVLGSIDRLPSVPESYWELTRAVARPETSVGDIANIVRRDGAMADKVLQLVNSAYFGLRQRIASIHQAVSFLGVEVIKALTLTAHAFAAVEAQLGAELELLQAEALGVARICKRLLTPRHADEGFTAALLHDIGKLVLAVGLPGLYAQATATARATGRGIHAVEKEVIGLTHADAGAYLLGMWGLPFPIVEVAAYHHDPAAVADGDRTVLAAVHVADTLIAGGRPDPAVLEQVGLGDELARWRRVIDEEARVAAV